ncbi:NAD(P)/FAD-dependent oxidoreductase [Cohnella fermenti]|uniref:Ferredoxin--NADP reductase n=1 Tax=Cohnella fermenti TaxID=2565925 RepID=A0A4S4C649_9BACL|nr:NAD(P)/FAD-dependent oxidoreductase [Cohnella fermenti]THF83341.1 NAD(P)/FAD-dependent oxidoreductase [Cohnella fermenti]
MPELYDVTIVGGGPAGLYAAFYSGLRDLKTKLIEAQEQLGGQMLAYPDKVVWDVGGLTPVRGEQLTEQLIRQATTFEPTIVLGQLIAVCEQMADGTFVLTANTGARHRTRAIILAVGYGKSKPAKLDIEGAERFEGTNLHYTVQDLADFQGKRVVISGGGDAAVDWANALVAIADSVTIVHRRDRFRGHEGNVNRMRASGVDIRIPYRVLALHSVNRTTIEQVSIENVATGEQEVLEVDAIIVSHGSRSDFGPLDKWGLDMSEWTAKVGEKMTTNIPGVFGAGDFVSHGGKVGLLAGAFTDAILAVNSAKLYIDPQSAATAGVSSHNDRFAEKNRQLASCTEEPPVTARTSRRKP